MEHTNQLCIILEHGLGNQLFILFAGISKALDENRDFIIYHIYNTFRKFYFSTLLKSLVFKVTGRVNLSSKDEMYEEPFFHHNPIPDNKRAIKGYFQSYKYFDKNKDKIIDILGLNKFMDKYKLDNQDKNEELVAIHLRFGDYTFNRGNHYLLSSKYYLNAIEFLLKNNNENENKYNFIVFGEKDDDEIIDDFINEFKNKFPGLMFDKFYEINNKNKDYQELMYMASCNHIITANSTYSWFAGYLNNNKNKKIIYSDKWFGCNNSHLKTKDLFPPEWICIKQTDL